MTVAAITAFSSCSSDDDIIDDQYVTSTKVFTATIESDGNTRTTLVDKTPNWELGDEISIDGHIYTANSAGTSSTFAGTDATESIHHAYFPADIYNNGVPTLPATYTYTEGKFNMPMYAESSTTNLAFKNICGVLAITIPNSQMASVSSITISSDKRMNGEFSANEDGIMSFASDASTEADKIVTLIFPTKKEISNSETFYVPIPTATHNPLTIVVTNGTTAKTMTTRTLAGVNVERNKIYNIDFADNNPNLLPGVFSVNDIRQVKFTKGNLWANPAASPASKILAFEENQYDYSVKDINAGHYGRFYWTKDYFKAFDVGYYVEDENIKDKFGYSEYYFKQTIDGIKQPYALSKAEWYYLINVRTNASKLYKCGVSVAGKSGCLVIAPDGYNGTIKTSYTTEEWTTAESSGLVCLRSDGYWMSTPDYSSNTQAYYLNVESSSVSLSGRTYRKELKSLRLVQAVPTAPKVDNRDNLLPGNFSVGSSKTVKFTKSNLYWDGSTYRFETAQHNFPETWDPQHVGHFYWTKTASKSYVETYNEGSNTSNDVPFFAESKGGLTVEGTSNLYVLSESEWYYLVNTRTNASTLRKYGVNVAGKRNCLILAPDGFTGTIATSYTAQTWANAESRYGLVCLPAAGERSDWYFYYTNHYSPYDTQVMGSYWTSTPYTSSAELKETHANSAGFNNSSYRRQGTARKSGLSIRLVQ